MHFLYKGENQFLSKKQFYSLTLFLENVSKFSYNELIFLSLFAVLAYD